MIEATTTTAEIAEHEHAGLEDVGRVALGDAVVDDVAVERGEVQRRQRLDDEEADDQGEGALVRREVRAEERDHAGWRLPFA